MAIGISNVTHAPAPAPTTSAPPKKPSQPAKQTAPATDSVQISKTAQTAAAALQEARETPTQTSQEAARGDLQARRLAAKEAAAHPAVK